MVFFKQFYLRSFVFAQVITEVELERKALYTNMAMLGVGIFQTRAYMTLVWGDSFVHGVLTLGASLKSVRSLRSSCPYTTF